MKKIYTMLSGLLLASAFTAQAYQVEFTLYDADWNKVGKTTTTEVTISEDGKEITVDNFVNSGVPVTFSVEGNDEINGLTFLSNYTFNKGYEEFLYLQNADKEYIHGMSIPEDGEEVVNFYDLCVYNGYWWSDEVSKWEGSYYYKFAADWAGWHNLSFYFYGGTDAEWTAETDYYIWFAEFDTTGSSEEPIVPDPVEPDPVEPDPTVPSKSYEVEFTLYDANWQTVGKTTTAEVTISDDGKQITIANFVNSGEPITLGVEGIVGVNPMTFLSNNYSSTSQGYTYVYPQNADKGYLHGVSIPEEGEEVVNFYDLCVCNNYWWLDEDEMYEGTYYYKYDGEWDGWHTLSFYFYGGTDADWTDSTDYYQWYAQFETETSSTPVEPDPVEPDPVEPAQGEVTFTVKTSVYDAENDEYNWVETGESFTTAISSTEPNTLTLADFFRSGSPVTISFDIAKAWFPTPITFKNSYIDEGYEDYPYLLDSNGDYMTCWNVPLEGEKEGIYYTYVNNTIDSKNAPKSYIYDMEDNDYFLCFYVAGFTADDKDTPYYRLESNTFNFEIMKDDPSAVAKIEANEDAPVIFYNLNGQRVNNPSNGIFIRKQGTKTSKVIIR